MANEQEEISIKDLILKLNFLFRYLRSKWIIIFSFAVVGAVAGYLYAYLAKPEYKADLTFVLSTQSKMSGLAGLAGQFGFDIGGSTDDLFSGDNIIELFKSKKIIKGALFKMLPDKSQTLINLIIDKSKIRENWQKKERFAALLPFPNDPDKLTPIQDSLVSELHEFVIKNYLTVEKTDKKLSFYQVSSNSGDEKTSYYLTKYLVDEASKFYIETKTQTSRLNLNMLQHEADSLRNLLGGAITTTAAAADKTFNLNPAYQVQRSQAQQGQLQATVLGTAYGEVVKNLEIAKITLQKETPLYQVIDEPQLPLKIKKAGKLKSLVIGGFLAGILAAAYLVFRKLFRGLMRQK